MTAPPLLLLPLARVVTPPGADETGDLCSRNPSAAPCHAHQVSSRSTETGHNCRKDQCSGLGENAPPVLVHRRTLIALRSQSRTTSPLPEPQAASAVRQHVAAKLPASRGTSAVCRLVAMCVRAVPVAMPATAHGSQSGAEPHGMMKSRVRLPDKQAEDAGGGASAEQTWIWRMRAGRDAAKSAQRTPRCGHRGGRGGRRKGGA